MLDHYIVLKTTTQVIFDSLSASKILKRQVYESSHLHVVQLQHKLFLSNVEL